MGNAYRIRPLYQVLFYSKFMCLELYPIAFAFNGTLLVNDTRRLSRVWAPTFENYILGDLLFRMPLHTLYDWNLSSNARRILVNEKGFGPVSGSDGMEHHSSRFKHCVNCKITFYNAKINNTRTHSSYLCNFLHSL